MIEPVPLLILDLDGTVRQGKDDPLGKFVNGPDDVVVFPQAVEMMRRHKNAGGRIMGASNQGGIALGHVTTEQVYAAMEKTYLDTEQLFDKICICSHHPSADRLEDSRCWCRKPLPGMVIEGVVDLANFYGERYVPWMMLFVGDLLEDQECARLLGVDFQWAAEWRAMAEIEVS